MNVLNTVLSFLSSMFNTKPRSQFLYSLKKFFEFSFFSFSMYSSNSKAASGLSKISIALYINPSIA